MPTTIYHNDGDMEYKFELTQEGIKQYSCFPLGERYDCTWLFSENRDNLPIPSLWKINKVSLFGFLLESQFASDDEWAQIQILQKGLAG